MLSTSDLQQEALLSSLAEDIDVPESKYEEARQHYRAVGDWLAAEGSPLAVCDVTVSAQGSFALGTAIKPAEGCDYDVDAVCLVRCPQAWTQEQFKEQVGARLRAHATYRAMLKPPEGRRRCWTLQYADGSQFHLDVLPAKPDDYGWLERVGVPRRYAELAVQITCRECFDDVVWPKSNPGGYQRWFIDRMRVRFDESRRILAKARSADVQAIPDYAVRTPLQRVVQMLKRQRDVMFGDDPERPISIIITTLAARAYQNEADLKTAYRNIVRGMRSHVDLINGRYVILNPVNPLENFADRWEANRDLEVRFFEWLTVVEETERELSEEGDLDRSAELLLKSFGPSATRAAATAAAAFGVTSIAPLSEAARLSERLGSIMQASHRQSPPWPPAGTSHTATVSAKASRPGYRTVAFSDRSPSAPLRKGMDIDFRLKTSVDGDFDVFWQVVNTGADAAAEGTRGLRGGFDAGSSSHREKTLYAGRHSIQAFVVQNGRCVATTRPVYVLIR